MSIKAIKRITDSNLSLATASGDKICGITPLAGLPTTAPASFPMLGVLTEDPVPRLAGAVRALQESNIQLTQHAAALNAEITKQQFEIATLEAELRMLGAWEENLSKKE